MLFLRYHEDYLLKKKRDDKINILIISPHYKYYIKDQVEALSKFKFQFYVILIYNPLTVFSSLIPSIGNSDYYKKFSKRFLVDDTNIPNNVKIVLLPLVYLIPDGSNRSIGEKMYKRVFNYIIQEKITFDLIHAHFTWPCGYVAARLKKELEVPAIITIHGFDIYSLPFRGPQWKERIKFAIKSVDHIISVSEKNVEYLREIYTSTPISIIPNGFSSELFYKKSLIECRRRLNLPKNKKIILTIGNLEEIKGHKYIINAINLLKQRRGDIFWILIGSGKLKDYLLQEIQFFRIENYLKLISTIPHHEVFLWMNAADLFVLPSLNEGNPTVMFESLGCGLPFLGTCVGGVPEIITSEDYGLLLDPGNSDDLTDKIIIALDKEWDRLKITKYAKQFTWEKISEQIDEIYTNITN